MTDLEIAAAQLESWIDNKAKVIIAFENGFCVSLREPGTLERFEKHFVFSNSVSTVHFDFRYAIPEVRFEDGVYQVRLRYNCGLLTFWECNTTELDQNEDADGVNTRLR